MHKSARFQSMLEPRCGVVQLPLPRDCRALQWQRRPLNSVAAAAVAVGVATTHTHTHSLRPQPPQRASERQQEPRCPYVSHERSRIKRNGEREGERERGTALSSFANSSPVIIVITVTAIPFHPRCLLLERNTRGRLHLMRSLFNEGEREGMFLPKGSFPSPSAPLPPSFLVFKRREGERGSGYTRRLVGPIPPSNHVVCLCSE